MQTALLSIAQMLQSLPAHIFTGLSSENMEAAKMVSDMATDHPLSPEARDFIGAIRRFIDQLGGPAVIGAAAGAAGFIGGLAKNAATIRKLKAEENVAEAERTKVEAEIRILKIEALDAHWTELLTRYEKRMDDLAKEVEELRRVVCDCGKKR